MNTPKLTLPLPSTLRPPGACELLRVLYLDRYPQLPFCGRATLPEQLWIYEVRGVTNGGTPNVTMSLTPLLLYGFHPHLHHHPYHHY